MNDMKIWYMSKTVWGGAVAILASCANPLGLEIASEDETGLVDGLTALAAAVGRAGRDLGPDFGPSAIAVDAAQVCAKHGVIRTFICHSDCIVY
ncbi:hypothetical protein LP421_12540 [Rhizobium sp. RCAM05350]|nr:hypothetical protein LP421_12540 [Rhizobium sp. RCAM05350]